MKNKSTAGRLAWIDSFTHVHPNPGPISLEPTSAEMIRRQEDVKARIEKNAEVSREMQMQLEKSSRADEDWIAGFRKEMMIEGPTTRNQRRKLHPTHTQFLNQNPKEARSLIEALFRWAENQAPESDYHEWRRIAAPNDETIRALLSEHLTALNSSMNDPAKRSGVFERFIFDVESIINSAAWYEENKTRLRSYLTLLEHVSFHCKFIDAASEHQCLGYVAFLGNFARAHKLDGLSFIELQLAYLKYELSRLIKTYGAGVEGGNTSTRDHLADEVVLLKLWGLGFSFGERLKLLNAALVASLVVKQSRRRDSEGLQSREKEEDLFRQDKTWLDRLEDRHCELKREFEADRSDDHKEGLENLGA